MDGLLLPPDSRELGEMFTKVHTYMNNPALMELCTQEKKEKLNQLYEQVVKAMQNCYQVNLEEILKDRTISANHVLATNKKMFQAFCSYSNTCRFISNNLLDLCEKEGTGRDIIIACNVGHIIRLMDQVEIMLMNGYPDGAFRAWRSMYENIVTTTILLHCQDMNVFIQYGEHGVQKGKRRASLYEKLRISPELMEYDLPSIGQEGMNEEFESVKQKYGKDFFNGEYAWASSIIGKKKATFRDLEDFAGYSLLRIIYVIASDYSHSNFNNIADHLVVGGSHVGNLSSSEKNNQMLFLPMAATILSLEPLIKKLITDYSNAHEQEFNLTSIRQLQMDYFECLKEAAL